METAALIRQIGRRAYCIEAELADQQQAGELFHRCLDAAGPISILINNASFFPSDHILEITPEKILESLWVHGISPLLLMRALAQQKLPSADIVNLLDCRMNDYDHKHASYHLGKRMLLTLTRMLAIELAPAVRVNGIAPGLILPPEDKGHDYLENLAHTNPLDSVGAVEQVVSAVHYLLDNYFITGQVIYVDGGRHLRGHVYG
jgi:NAD(P)-dependent dehydrogenase (short-subunit alcohol dehydrogenase family)